MNWKLILAALLLGCLAAEPAAAGQLADVTVFDASAGRALPAHAYDGRFYVVGRPGNEYQIRIRNHTGAEVLAVVSVDGVNAVSGETATWNQTGYVLAPYQTVVVKGWRKSLQRVATFYFTEHANSYAARTGRPHNVGVIGVALFRKRPDADTRITPRPWSPAPRGTMDESPFPDDQGSAREEESTRQSAAEPAPFGDPKLERSEAAADAPRSAGRSDATAGGIYPRAPSVARKSKLGTGHGRNRSSHARYTSFERASESPAQVATIHYDTYGNLVRLGVIGSPRMANPFPGQFVPDPM